MDKQKKFFHIHLLSDATGETLDFMIKAVTSQFENVHPILHVSFMIRSLVQLEQALQQVEEIPGIVIYTITSKELCDRLEQKCNELQIETLPALEPMLKLFEDFLEQKQKFIIAAQHVLNEDYYKRIRAVDFTLSHDDGNQLWDVEEADILIFGVSRTSKTPTCMYLAHRGFSVANIPLIQETKIDEKYFQLSKPLLIGLTIRPDRLIEIRKSRLINLGTNEIQKEFSYIDQEKVIQEIMFAKKLYARYLIQTIDVTRKSVEETASKIISIYSERKRGV